VPGSEPIWRFSQLPRTVGEGFISILTIGGILDDAGRDVGMFAAGKRWIATPPRARRGFVVTSASQRRLEIVDHAKHVLYLFMKASSSF